MTEKHEQWMNEYGRIYKDESEKSKHFEIFKENVKYNESVNKAGNCSYKFGINEFTDLSDEEFRSRFLGYKSSDSFTVSTSFMYENVIDVPKNLD